MTLRAVSRWLSRQLSRAATQVSPCEREEWAQAMSREVDEIPSEREALRWALGCLQASCHERLKSMRAGSLGNGAMDCTFGDRRPFLCRYHPNLQTWTFHRALSLSSECPVARGNTTLGAAANPSCGCGASLGDCSHIEAQSGCIRGRRGSLRHHAVAIRGQIQPARVRIPREPVSCLSRIALRVGMADRGLGSHDFHLPRAMA